MYHETEMAGTMWHGVSSQHANRKPDCASRIIKHPGHLLPGPGQGMGASFQQFAGRTPGTHAMSGTSSSQELKLLAKPARCPVCP